MVPIAVAPITLGSLTGGKSGLSPTPLGGARKPNADFLRNRTPVGGRTNVPPVEFENSHVVGTAEVRPIVLMVGGADLCDMGRAPCASQSPARLYVLQGWSTAGPSH